MDRREVERSGNEYSSNKKREISYEMNQEKGQQQEEQEEGQEEHQLFSDDKKKKKVVPKWKKEIIKFINGAPVGIFMTVITIYSLFFDDLRQLTIHPDNDQICFGVTAACMACFAIEILLASIAIDDYFLSFFFWLDVISTISMIPDIGWLWDLITGQGSSSNVDNAGQLAKTSRASRVTRVIRVIRLIRLIRIVKLYKQAKLAQQKQNEKKQQQKKLIRAAPLQQSRTQNERQQTDRNQKVGPVIEENKDDSFEREIKQIDQKDKQQKEENQQQDASIENQYDKSISKINIENPEIDEDENIEDLVVESRISKKLTDRTNQIVIILVLILLFILPMFQSSQWFTEPSSMELGFSLCLQHYNQQKWQEFRVAMQTYIIQNTNTDYPIIYMEIPDISQESHNFSDPQILQWENYSPKISDLRSDEINSVVFTANNGVEFLSVWSILKESYITSGLSISRTVFVCLVLTIASIFFTNDANVLVLAPLERMLEKVKLIAQNPLAASSDAVDDAGLYSMMHQKELQDQKNNKQNDQGAQYETAVLEQAIVKIGHLLALGFGEAGSKIIASNMNEGGDLNPMMGGQKCHAIFGFCDIRNFTDSTEVLQTKVMLFVNQIAEITHSQVDKYGGSANKNIGDAFLLVWKFKKEEDFRVGRQIGRENKIVADMALFSFIKIIAKINKYSHILEYRKDEGLNARMPDYKVKMGFGLHQGWAIEGAIGSFFKIDASYLSPNVNMASRLEAATKQYGVPLLISGALYDILSKDVQKFCREIDTVTVKGSLQPMRLYTVDIDQDNLEEIQAKNQSLAIKEKKSLNEQEKKQLSDKLFSGRRNTYQIYEKDLDFKEMRKSFNEELNKKFGEGYKKYISGDWATAEDYFSQCLKMKPQDGPTLTLKNYIEELNGAPPSNWKGFRELTEK